MKDKCKIEKVIKKSCIPFIICLLENFHGYCSDVHENLSQITHNNNNNNNNNNNLYIYIYILFLFFIYYFLLIPFYGACFFGKLPFSFIENTRFLCNFFLSILSFYLNYMVLPFYSFYNILLNFN